MRGDKAKNLKLLQSEYNTVSSRISSLNLKVILTDVDQREIEACNRRLDTLKERILEINPTEDID
jgi:hypothetical protein